MQLVNAVSKGVYGTNKPIHKINRLNVPNNELPGNSHSCNYEKFDVKTRISTNNPLSLLNLETQAILCYHISSDIHAKYLFLQEYTVLGNHSRLNANSIFYTCAKIPGISSLLNLNLKKTTRELNFFMSRSIVRPL